METSDACEPRGVICVAETLEAREEVLEGLLAGTGGLGPRDDAYERCEARDSIESMDAFDMLNSWL